MAWWADGRFLSTVIPDVGANHYSVSYVYNLV